MANNDNNETYTNTSELVCDNWEPVATIRNKGAHRIDGRKVKTRGIAYLPLGDEFDSITKGLRCGYEVRICRECEDDSAIRIYPCVSKDFKMMYPAAQTMGKWRETALADKTAKLEKSGKRVTVNQILRYRSEREAEANVDEPEVIDPEFDEVTPDITVKCDRCGHRFRVGRRIAG